VQAAVAGDYIPGESAIKKKTSDTGWGATKTGNKTRIMAAAAAAAVSAAGGGEKEEGEATTTMPARVPLPSDETST
jgi:hypothetical protein